MPTPNLSNARWFTASASDNKNCVEVAFLDDGSVALRDSKDRSKPPHVFTSHEWACFLDGARKGEFDPR
ncbi:DUF397 domain-containing protein [Allostreptomyces psammosilenae]|uniref:DUF397 domain-containing protein n=1 Tax=Allostreptomyces psammosilenae TaxID=1892865 RepID=A0A853A4Y3_9ACTN|nr:DUF397 domain-containing protein [Allostreptomyces psammosilenae]NYI07934.1 hypothetical protein [Allostreptomyces psammosilenae]